MLKMEQPEDTHVKPKDSGQSQDDKFLCPLV